MRKKKEKVFYLNINLVWNTSAFSFKHRNSYAIAALLLVGFNLETSAPRKTI